MRQALAVVVLCVLGVALAVCGGHGGGSPGEDLAFHGLGCGAPATVLVPVIGALALPLTGGLVPPTTRHRPPRRSASVFHPPEPSA